MEVSCKAESMVRIKPAVVGVASCMIAVNDGVHQVCLNKNIVNF
jgi:hypothetical protein